MSEEASERFHTVLAGKKLIPERGLRPDATKTGHIATMIAETRWWEFTKQPEAAVISIVKEFYANAKEAEGFVIQVQGKSVPFDSTSINSYYQLEDMVVDDDFTQYYHNYLDLNEVIKCLCRPGAK